MADRLLRIQEASEVLGVSEWVLRKWVSRGLGGRSLRVKKVGGRVWLRLSWVRRFLRGVNNGRSQDVS